VLVGLSMPFRAWALIRATPALRRLTGACAAVTLATLVAVAVGVVLYGDDLVGLVYARPVGGAALALWWLAVVLASLLLFVVGALTLPTLLLVPLQDPLSEAAEEACGDFRAPAFSVGGLVRGTLAGLVQTLARLAFLFLGLAALSPLHLVPGVGSLVATALGTVWAAVWVAAEHLGAPMARHLYPVRELTALLRRRLGLCLGFGGSVYVLLLVPVLNAFFLPVAVVGGTLLFRALRQAGALGPPPAPAGRG
jgi:CysZ protein